MRCMGESMSCYICPLYTWTVLVRRLGDLIAATPMLRALKAKYPNARLRLVASKLGKDAAGLIPWVDEAVLLGPGAFWKLAACPGELTIDLNPSFSKTSALLL